jgi:hypothetical protein
MPGCGKTFIANELVREMKKQGYDVDDLGPRLGRAGSIRRIVCKLSLVIWYLFANRRSIRFVLTLSKLGARDGLIRQFKLMFNWLFVLSLICHGADNDSCVILDQGVVQALWSTLFSGTAGNYANSAHAFQQFLKFLPIESLCVVHVQANEEKIKARLRSRTGGKSPLDRNLDGSWCRTSKALGNAVSILTNLAKTSSSIRIVNFENNHDTLGSQALSHLIKYIFTFSPE